MRCQSITSTRAHRFFSTLVLGAVLGLWSTPAPAQDISGPEAAALKAPRRVTLTVSGGVSKGSYQAGLNYGLVYLMRWVNDHPEARGALKLPPFELAAITGASAGNINALLTAIAWCDGALLDQRADTSLFWNIWTPVGIEQLFPAQRPDPRTLRQPDFIFSRAYFDTVLYGRLAEALETPPDTTGCIVPFGITLTRTDRAGEITLTDGLTVSTMRYVSLAVLQARSGGQGLAFQPFPFGTTVDKTQFGALALPMLDSLVARDREEEARKKAQEGARILMDFSLASSAFPGAFAPVELSFRPEPGRAPETGLFFDGGAFDNNPLDLARRLGDLRRISRSGGREGPRYEQRTVADIKGLAERPAMSSAVPAALPADDDADRSDIWSFYIDPDFKRPAEPIDGERRRQRQDPEAMSLAVYAPFVRNGIGAARQYELEVLGRDLLPDERQRLRLTDRFHPITGTSLFSFGAFFSRLFREYDYYVGLYDATAFLAAQSFGGENYTTRRRRQRQLLDALPLTEEAAELMEWLFRREHGNAPPCRPAGHPDAHSNAYIAVGCAVQAWENERGKTALDLVPLLDALPRYLPKDSLRREAEACRQRREARRAKSRDTAAAGTPDWSGECRVDSYMLDLMQNPSRELSHLGEAALGHLRANEHRASGAKAERYVELAYFVQRTAMLRYETGFSWDNSSIPSSRLRGLPAKPPISSRTLWRVFAPRETFLSIRDGGWGIGYRPRYRPAWLYKATGIGFTGAGTYVNYGDAAHRVVLGAGLEWTPGRIIGGWPEGFIRNLEARATTVPHVGPLERKDAEWFGSTGLEVSAYLLHGKLRVATHQPALFRGQTWEPDDTWAITIGIADLNGLSYWVYHLLR